MRWKISHGGHDPRQIDLLAVIALLALIVAGFVYMTHDSISPPTTALIVPSQRVRW